MLRAASRSLALAFVVPLAAAQSPCDDPTWIPFLGGAPGSDRDVTALLVSTAFGGEQVFAGGRFLVMDGVHAPGVARWDGSAWHALGGGIYLTESLSSGGSVSALAEFDDGSGPAVYAGGTFSVAGGQPIANLARWDGMSWSALGSPNGVVRALTVFDDGTGPALFAAGNFTEIGALPVARVAKWDGTTWSSLGGGLGDDVRALAVADLGDGPKLYAGGDFLHAGGQPASRVARWDGASWSPLPGDGGEGVDARVHALVEHEEGGSTALFAAGEFTNAGGTVVSRLARWENGMWRNVGGGVNSDVYTLLSADDGTGQGLFVGGSFWMAGGLPAARIARWRDGVWSPLGEGLSTAPGAYALAATTVGTPKLFVGGSFYGSGELAARNLVHWTGEEWRVTAPGVGTGVFAVAAYEQDPAGPALYFAGSFTSVGNVLARRIARWDGATISEVGGGAGNVVRSLAIFDAGQGAELYAAGAFLEVGGVPALRIARWNGATWSPLGSGLNFPANDLCVFDDGSGAALYVGGAFTVAGGVLTSRVARWDGNGWSAVGNNVPAVVNTLAVFDDGSGARLHIGGGFAASGAGVPLNRVARLVGNTWEPLGDGVTGKITGTDIHGPVHALEVFDDGSGPALYVGGNFQSSGSLALNGLGRWDGTSWSAVGTGANGVVLHLATFLGEDGPQLAVGGDFDAIDGTPMRRMGRFDGTTWRTFPPVRVDRVGMLASVSFGGGELLYSATTDDGFPAGTLVPSSLEHGDQHFGRWGCLPSVAPVPGCHGNGPQLSSSSPWARIGKSLTLGLANATHPVGVAVLYGGVPATDVDGCGIVLPGLGELLLAPTAFVLAIEPTDGAVAFPLAVPATTALIGLTIGFQAAHVGAVAGLPVELSSGVKAKLVP